MWTLEVGGGRNDRFGMLHNWALRVAPQNAGFASTVVQDQPQPVAKQDGGDQRGNQDRKLVEKAQREQIKQRFEERVRGVREWQRSSMEKLNSGEVTGKEAEALREKLSKVDVYIKAMKDRYNNQKQEYKQQLKKSK